jgi:hypothetical protein
VDDEQTRHLPARLDFACERLHCGQGERLVMRKLQRLDPAAGPHLADERGDSPRIAVGGKEAVDFGRGIERPGEQADVGSHVSLR